MRILKAILLLSAIVLSGCGAKEMIRADELASKGEWDEAVLKYAELYEQDPGNLEYRNKYRLARFEAAQVHYHRGEDHLSGGNHEGALLEFQAALLLDPTLGKAQEGLRRTKRLMDSLYYYGKGLELMKEGNVKEARASFKKALALNPDNEAAGAELEKLKREQRVVLDGYELDLKSTEAITLEFKDASIKRLFEAISRLSGINFVFDQDVRDFNTTISLKGATFQQALDLVLATNKLSRKVVSENTIVIYPATPQKVAQYEELMIRVFYLTNIDAKKAINLLRTMIRARDIHVHEDLNAIVLRARPDVVELAEKILEATDLADSEVMLAVEIIEVSRNKALNLGVNLSPDALSAAVPTTDGTITLGELGRLSSEDLLVTLPTVFLNFKAEDLDANLLANPRIRVKNNGKARIHIGDRVPIITTTVNQGVSSETVQYLDVGLKLTVEPVIRQNDEIDLKLSLEVSSLGSKTTTASGTVAYQIGTRNAETLLRLHDGETQIIGGLINDEERTTVAKLPLLGEVPIIGDFFSNRESNRVKTDILLSITPHIVRRLEVPEEGVTSIPSGREEIPSARPFMEGPPPGELPGAPETQPAPVPFPLPVPSPAPGAPYTLPTFP